MSTRRRDADARLATIRALLAKAEATPFSEEAEAFTAKASELMARFAIDEAMVWAHDSSDARSAPEEIRIEIHRPFLAQKAVLVSEISTILGCRSIRFIGRSGDPTETVSIVGFGPDLDLVETLVTSLFLQLTAAMTSGSAVGHTAAQVSAWRRSFIVGFGESVCARLTADRALAVAAERGRPNPSPGTGAGQTSSTELVLADRGDAVESEFRRRHPRVRQVRVGTGSSESGRRAGTTAGRRADLGSPRLRPQRALPR